MRLTDIIKSKGLKQSSMAEAIGIDKSDFCKRVHKNRIWLEELKLLRIKNVLSLDDIDILTK